MDLTRYRENNHGTGEDESLPYVVLSVLTVPEGITLTIEPGTVVKAKNETGPSDLIVEGTLDSLGTPSDGVTFTALADDTVWGDTNNDGSSEGSPGEWGGITVTGSTPSNLSHTHLTYTGHYPPDDSYFSLYLEGGDHQVAHCSIREALWGGVLVGSGGPTIDDTTISECARGGLWIRGSGGPTISGCTVQDITGFGVYVETGSPAITGCLIQRISYYQSDYGDGIKVDTTGNANVTANRIENCEESAINLGDSPPDNVRGNYGSGNRTNGILLSGTCRGDATWNFTNHGTGGDESLPYVMLSTLTVPDGVTLTMEPGVVVKAWGGSTGIDVQGVLNISGQETNPVRVTALADDTVWGDTNNDGFSEGSPGEWGGIAVTGSTPSNLSHTHLTYTGHSPPAYSYYGLYLEGGDHTVEHCSIREALWGGVLVENGSPTIDDTTISGCGACGLLTRGDPTISGCTVQDTAGYGVSVEGGSPTVTDCLIGRISYYQSDYGDGIKVDTTGNANVTANTIEECVSSGIRIDNCGPSSTVASNTVNDCSGFLGIVGSGSAFYNADIHDNKGAGSRYNGFELGGAGTLGQDKYMKKNDIPYTLITGDLTVSSGANITTQAGIVFKSMNHGITVSGGSALGCDESTFTSVFDDSVGGKTINQPDIEKNPDESDWVGINAQSGSSISLNKTTLAYGQTLLTLGDGVSLGEVSEFHVINGEYDKVQGVHTRPGGVGVRFNGESNTTIRNSTLEWCDKAISINLMPWHEGEIYPTISENNRIWSCTYGIWVEGAISEQHEAILAEGNDWCDDSKFSYNNGPFPIGDGSGIYAGGLDLSSALDVIYVWPWLDHQRDADDQAGLEVGIYQLSSDDGFDRYKMLDMVNEFRIEYGVPESQDPGETDSLIRHFELPETASERMLRPESSTIDGVPGQDSKMFDNVDLAWVNSHALIAPDSYENGQTSRPIYGYVCFDNADLFHPGTPGGRDLRSDVISWGDDDLEWVIIDGCRFLARDNQADARFGGVNGIHGIEGIIPTKDNDDAYTIKEDLDERYKASTVDKGLHMLLGHATVSSTRDRHCVPFVKSIFGHEEQPTRPIVEAYLIESSRYQRYDSRRNNPGVIWESESVGAIQWGAMTVAYGSFSNVNDYVKYFPDLSGGDPGPGSSTILVARSADEDSGGSMGDEAPEPQPELKVTPLDSSGNPTNVVEPGKACTFEVEKRPGCSWPSFVPAPLDDVQFSLHSGIYAEFTKVDENGIPVDPETVPDTIVECTLVSDDTLSIIIPSYSPGDHCKVRIYNSRTWYWGSPDHMLTIEDEQSQP